MRHQLISAILRLTQAGLLVGDVDVIIDVGVVGGEVAVGNSQGYLAVLHRQMLQFDHMRNLHQ